MRQHHCGNALGQHLDQRDVILRDDHANRVGDDVVGEHVAHVFGRMARAQHAGIDAEPHLLRLRALARVGADAHRQHEIVHEHTIRPLVLARIGRIAARRQQPIIDFRRRRWVMRKLRDVRGDQAAHFIDRSVAGGGTQSGAAENVGGEQQQAWDVRRLERAGETGQQPLRMRGIDEIRERADLHGIKQAAIVFARGIEHQTGKAGVLD